MTPTNDDNSNLNAFVETLYLRALTIFQQLDIQDVKPILWNVGTFLCFQEVRLWKFCDVGGVLGFWGF